MSSSIGRTGRAGHRGEALSFFVLANGADSGDTNLARELADILDGAEQEVPHWLEQAVRAKGHRDWEKNRRRGGKGKGRGGNFGARDVRGHNYGAGQSNNQWRNSPRNGGGFGGGKGKQWNFLV